MLLFDAQRSCMNMQVRLARAEQEIAQGRSVPVVAVLLLDDATGLLSAYCRVGDGLLG